MAGFVETMEQWRRMCRSMDGNDPYQKCERCPLGEEHICSFEISDIPDDELHRVEEKVMSWAAENPEPVYETWGQYFRRYYGLEYCKDHEMLLENIPADIAKKLGIEPKHS